MSMELKTVGELLRETRETRGLAIESIAKDICVKSSYLVAIEAGDHKELPEKTFTVGFVRAYAMALKLDAESTVSQFKDEYGVDETESATPPEVVVKPRRRLPGWLSPLTGVIGVSLCWALFGGSIVPFSLSAERELVDRKTDVAQLKAVQASLPVSVPNVVKTTAAVDVAEVSVSTTDATVAEPVSMLTNTGFVATQSLFLPAAIADQNSRAVAAHSDFLLKATEDSWVRLENTDGTEIWSGVLREGQSYRPLLEGTALLSTTNAGGVTVHFDGQTLASLGSRGEVVEDIRLDGDKFASSVSATATGPAGFR